MSDNKKLEKLLKELRYDLGNKADALNKLGEIVSPELKLVLEKHTLELEKIAIKAEETLRKENENKLQENSAIDANLAVAQLLQNDSDNNNIQQEQNVVPKNRSAGLRPVIGGLTVSSLAKKVSSSLDIPKPNARPKLRPGDISNS